MRTLREREREQGESELTDRADSENEKTSRL